MPLYHERPSMFRNRPILFLLLIGVPVYLIFRGDDAARGGGILLAGISGLVMLVWWLRCRTTALTVTEEKVTLRHGIVSKDTNDVWIRDVRNVRVKQGPIQRLLGVGYVGISSAGQADVEIQAQGMPRPGQIKRIIDAQKNSAKARDFA